MHARRLGRNLLLDPAPPGGLVDAVAAVCGVQAQVLAAAELAISARVDVTRADVRAALEEQRSLVKTYSLRGTLHLHGAEELPLWLAAMRAATGWRSAAWYAANELDAARLDGLLAAVTDALDGRELLREELAGEVAARAGPWARERLASTWADLVGVAAYAGRAATGLVDPETVQRHRSNH